MKRFDEVIIKFLGSIELVCLKSVSLSYQTKLRNITMTSDNHVSTSKTFATMRGFFE